MASWHSYVDLDEATRKDLKSAKIIDPATYGGIFRDASKSGQVINEFITHTVPDILPQTRIIAVCGATDEGGAANPTMDGWFFSDFYLFHHLFQGLGSQQHWISSEDPAELVSKYGVYLHGNPHKIRKVVLSSEMLETGRIGEITIHPRNQLKANFIKTLKSECAVARECNENVLILVFGHGDEETYGITIGTGTLRKMKISNVRSAIGSPGLPVTFLSTSCYSGGWSVSPRLNITTMTAAGPGQESTSWMASATLGRSCGSIWASAVVPVLLAESTSDSQPSSVTSESADEILPEDASEDQDKTFSSFCHAIWTHLYSKVDRKAAVHGITFSAQDDDWEKYWAQRTGFPLADYKRRYDALNDYPVSFLENPLTNRDVDMSHELEGKDTICKAEEQMRKFRMLRQEAEKKTLHQLGSDGVDAGGSREIDTQPQSVSGKRKRLGHFEDGNFSYQRQVTQMAEDYMASFPGEDNQGPNTSVHGLAKSCLRGEVTDPDMLSSLFQQLEYRSNIMKLADRYVAFTGCKTPKIPSCVEWDRNCIYALAGRGELPKEFYDELRCRIYRMGLFPQPNELQGPSWPKGANYLAAALALAGLGERGADQALKELLRRKFKQLISLYHLPPLSPLAFNSES
jgi:hypothetical protein